MKQKEENNKDNFLVDKIKSSSKYKTLTSSIIEKEVLLYRAKNKNESEKQMLKNIKAALHRTYASYQTKRKRKREEYLEELKKRLHKKEDITDITMHLLSITRSTKERLKSYPLLYKKIFSLTKKPRKILDIGSGLNPLSLPHMHLTKPTYHAYDIDEADVAFLNRYFTIMSPYVQGSATILDITDEKALKKIPNADIILMFKLLDLMKTDKIKLVETLLTKAPFIVVSFATRTLSGKPMKLQTRSVFEKRLEESNCRYKKITTENELFYVISQR